MSKERGIVMKMFHGLQKWLCNLCKTILSFIGKAVVKMSTPFVVWWNTRKKKAMQSRYFGRIEDISLYNFAKCCGGDLSYLYKKKAKRNAKEEIAVFQELVNQYNDCLHVDIKEYTNDIRYNVILARIRILESVNGITINEEVKKILRTIGVRLTNDNEKNVALLNSKIAMLMRELDQLRIEIQDKEKNVKLLSSMENFTNVLTAISTYYKMYLDIKTISVYEYCAYYQRYITEVKELQKQKSKFNGKGKN